MCDSIITRWLGSTGKIRVIADCVIYMRPLFKIFNTTLPGFHIRKQMPHPPSFGMQYQLVYLVLYVVITHKIFLNRGFNRCMSVK